MGGEIVEQPCDGTIRKDTGLTGRKKGPEGIQDLEKSSAALKPLSGFTEGMKDNLIREKLKTSQRRPRRDGFR